MTQSQLDILIRARDEASAVINRVQAAGTNLGTALNRSVSTAQAFQTSLGQVTA